jgi:hypothetical protein
MVIGEKIMADEEDVGGETTKSSKLDTQRRDRPHTTYVA